MRPIYAEHIIGISIEKVENIPLDKVESVPFIRIVLTIDGEKREVSTYELLKLIDLRNLIDFFNEQKV